MVEARVKVKWLNPRSNTSQRPGPKLDVSKLSHVSFPVLSQFVELFSCEFSLHLPVPLQPSPNGRDEAQVCSAENSMRVVNAVKQRQLFSTDPCQRVVAPCKACKVHGVE